MTPSAHAAKVMFVGTEDQAFCQHRLPMARALKAHGFDVTVVAGEMGARARIEGEGFRFIPWQVVRGSLNPLAELGAYRDIKATIAHERPDVMICVALKPILYGGFAAPPRTRTVNLFAGLGAVFVNPRPLMKLVQLAIVPFLRRILGRKGAWVVTQNKDNAAYLQALKIGDASRYALIPGSGVDLDVFTPQPEPEGDGPVVVTLVGRMLWDKGIRETVEAARRLKHGGVDVRIQLVGEPDPHNPATVPQATLKAYNQEGAVQWLGRQDDIVAVWRESHIALLPSYGEGVPKSLLEAAALARPMIAFDAPGSRDLVENGENGLLVPLGDALALADAIQRLCEDAKTRRTMGLKARETVEQAFSSEIIGAKLCRLVEAVIADGGR